MKIPIPKVPEGPSYRERFTPLPWDSFCTTSLLNWRESAGRARVTQIAASEVWRGPINSLLHFDEQGDHQQDIASLYTAIEAAKEPGRMFRWDTCGPMDLKGRLAAGKHEWDASLLDLPIDDPRAYDLLYEYPRHEIIVWSRPWVQARIVDGYPLEFRVFVKDSKVIGVSSYYPQRPLAPIYYSRAEDAAALTERLIKAIEPPCWVGENGDKWWRQDAVHATVDWMVAADGAMLFLEGGPPFGAGAHPCCFEGREKIEGIVLAPSNEARR